MMTAALVSIISRVIKSQQFFLYNSITFISISITSIPVPATHIPTTNISNNQYMIPAINAFGILVLICAAECPAAIVHPIKVCMNDAASFIQTFIGWTIDAGQSVAQISTKIPNEIIAGIIYWLLMILVVGICVAGTGILAILIEIKVIELYKKNCWDVITLLMILTSAAVIIYFGEVIKKALSINLLFFWLILQGIYLTIRRYISQDTD